MQVILVTDIFGVTEAVLALAVSLSNADEKAIVIDPFLGEMQEFPNEQQAYAAFVKHCGHQNYLSKVKTSIASAAEPVILLAFSAGASAAYKALEDCDKKVIQLIGFYPSQIRNHLDIVPKCPVTLIFPKREKHFSIDPVLESLALIACVHCYKSAYLHGFMNPLSLNYDPKSAGQFTRLINRVEKLVNVAQLRRKIMQL